MDAECREPASPSQAFSSEIRVHDSSRWCEGRPAEMLALTLFNQSRSGSRPYESRKQAASGSSRSLEFSERFFDKLKHYSAVATRYDKFARNFLAGVQMACAMILLN